MNVAVDGQRTSCWLGPGSWSEMLVAGGGLEGVVFSHPPAGSFDVEHDGVVHEPIQDGRGDDGVTEDFAPFG